jgi:hypothetical protein
MLPTIFKKQVVGINSPADRLQLGSSQRSYYVIIHVPEIAQTGQGEVIETGGPEVQETDKQGNFEKTKMENQKKASNMTKLRQILWQNSVRGAYWSEMKRPKTDDHDLDSFEDRLDEVTKSYYLPPITHHK